MTLREKLSVILDKYATDILDIVIFDYPERHADQAINRALDRILALLD